MATQHDKILDASVIIKWFIEEEGSDKAYDILTTYKERKFTIYAPTLLYYELGNILITKKAKKEQVSEIMKNLQSLNFINEDIGYDGFRAVFENAKDLQISYYDAAYITLMQKYNCELVTADKKLYEKVRKTYTKISLIYDHSTLV